MNTNCISNLENPLEKSIKEQIMFRIISLKNTSNKKGGSEMYLNGTQANCGFSVSNKYVSLLLVTLFISVSNPNKSDF